MAVMVICIQQGERYDIATEYGSFIFVAGGSGLVIYQSEMVRILDDQVPRDGKVHTGTQFRGAAVCMGRADEATWYQLLRSKWSQLEQ